MGGGRQFVRLAGAVLALAVAACRDEPTRAVTPFQVEASLSSAPGVEAGTLVDPAPTFVVVNVDGKPLANVPVTIAITRGGGTLRNVPLRTGPSPTPIGDWTLDTIAGVNEVTIVAGPAPAIHVAVTGVAGPAARITSTGPHDAPAGAIVDGLTLRLADRHGNAVPGAIVQLQVGTGGGEVSPASAMTDVSGRVEGVAWRLGRLGGPQRLSAVSGAARGDIDATIRSGFTPEVRFVGAPAAEVQAALAWAADRIRAGVTGDLGDVPVLNFDLSRCGVQGSTLSEVVDDVIIYAMVVPIDGGGRVLASAGPCVQRTQSRFPVIGVMRFDLEDITELSANGRLAPVVLHEMMHVMGLGSLWRDFLAGSGTQDPRFTGSKAAAECLAAGGMGYCSDGRVPVENTGGSGTAEVHWRESVFDSEVMTGYVETTASMPLSVMTLASLEDLGYRINRLSADPFQFGSPRAASPRLSAVLAPPWETLLEARWEIAPGGWLRPLNPR